METFHKFLDPESRWGAWLGGPDFDFNHIIASILIAVVAIIALYLAVHVEPSFAGVTRLPGDDASDKLEAAGTMLKILDTALFKWGARIFAGVCIMSSAWALKEQRFGIAIICVIGAIIFGTAPKWVKNIFDIGDNQSIFSQAEEVAPQNRVARIAQVERALANV